MTDQSYDFDVRIAAFAFLKEQTQLHGEALPRALLEKGFEYQGHRIPLISPQGIFTPRGLRVPLTICTAPPSLRNPPPYDDEVGKDDLIRYRYRGKDIQHRDNVGLRTAWKEQIPLIYLYGMVPGLYQPAWPMFIVGDDPANLTFSVAADEASAIQKTGFFMKEHGSDAKRRYITVTLQARLHQRCFRERVLNAYRDRCAICQLHHPELLEASHILPDRDPRSEPLISSGIAMCKLHHAAFDRNFLGIRPDYIVEIRPDILREQDGPMLKHGLQETQGQSLHVPRTASFQPRTDFLAIRCEEFKKVS